MNIWWFRKVVVSILCAGHGEVAIDLVVVLLISGIAS